MTNSNLPPGVGMKISCCLFLLRLVPRPVYYKTVIKMRRGVFDSNRTTPQVAAGLDEHVADSMGAGGVEVAAGQVPLEDGDSSSDAGYQGVDEGGDEVLSHRRRFGHDGVRNLMQRRVRARLL
jgi:hypothetical protein